MLILRTLFRQEERKTKGVITLEAYYKELYQVPPSQVYHLLEKWSTWAQGYIIVSNKSTLRAQISAKAAHCPDSQFRESAWWSRSHKNFINCSWYHCRAILKFSSKSTHNLLSYGWISYWTSQCGDPDHHQITCSFYHPGPSIKFHSNSFITFWVMLLTDKHTNRQTNATENIISLLEIRRRRFIFREVSYLN